MHLATRTKLDVSSSCRALGYIVLTLGYSLEIQGKDAFIDEFFIEPAFHGRGISKFALKHAESYAKRIGVMVIHLEVVRRNENALRIYNHFGFQDHDRYPVTKKTIAD